MTELTGRAVWFPAAWKAEVRTEQVGRPAAGEVLVRARVSLISAGTESVVYRGEAADSDPMPLYSAGSYAFPVKYGYQVIGVVEATGPGPEPDTAGARPGDRVFVRHPHQDLFTVRVSDSGVVPIPDDVSDEQAAFLNLARVATTAIWDAPVSPGDIVVVYGQGVVGALCTRLARRHAGAVLAVDPVPGRRRLAERMGADLAVAPQDAAAALDDLSQGRGADVTYETSGAGPALQAAIDGAGEEATICVVSYYGRNPVQLRLAPEFHWRRQRIISSHQSLMAQQRPRWTIQRRNAAVFADLARLDTADIVSDRVPLEDADRAYQLVTDRELGALAVLLTYPPGPAAEAGS